jgi:ATP-dependent Clp protease ATP-binding subunit ClpA
LRPVSREITEEDIAEVVSLWTGIPAAKLTQEESEKLLHMEDYLRQRVVGQENAVKTVCPNHQNGQNGAFIPYTTKRSVPVSRSDRCR